MIQLILQWRKRGKTKSRRTGGQKLKWGISNIHYLWWECISLFLFHQESERIIISKEQKSATSESWRATRKHVRGTAPLLTRRSRSAIILFYACSPNFAEIKALNCWNSNLYEENREAYLQKWAWLSRLPNMSLIPLTLKIRDCKILEHTMIK